jgi:hypothetical protein
MRSLLSLVFIQPPNPGSRIKAVYISKHASDINLEEDAGDGTKCHLTYSLASHDENGLV